MDAQKMLNEGQEEALRAEYQTYQNGGLVHRLEV